MEKPENIPAWFASELLKLFAGRHWGMPDPDLDVPVWWESVDDLPPRCVVEGMRLARRKPGFITEGDVRSEAIGVARRIAAELEQRRLALALAETVKPWTEEEKAEADRARGRWLKAVGG